MTPTRIYYFAIWALIALLTLLFEQEVLPTHIFNLTVEEQYASDLICIVLALGGTFLSLRLFVFNKIKCAINSSTHSLAIWSLIRCTIQGGAALANLLAYYLLLSGGTARYGVLIALAGLVFCLPPKGYPLPQETQHNEEDK